MGRAFVTKRWGCAGEGSGCARSREQRGETLHQHPAVNRKGRSGGGSGWCVNNGNNRFHGMFGAKMADFIVSHKFMKKDINTKKIQLHR